MVLDAQFYHFPLCLAQVVVSQKGFEARLDTPVACTLSDVRAVPWIWRHGHHGRDVSPAAANCHPASRARELRCLREENAERIPVIARCGMERSTACRSGAKGNNVR